MNRNFLKKRRSEFIDFSKNSDLILSPPPPPPFELEKKQVETKK